MQSNIHPSDSTLTMQTKSNLQLQKPPQVISYSDATSTQRPDPDRSLSSLQPPLRQESEPSNNLPLYNQSRNSVQIKPKQKQSPPTINNESILLPDFIPDFTSKPEPAPIRRPQIIQQDYSSAIPPRLKTTQSTALSKPSAKIIPIPIPVSLRHQAYNISQNAPFWLNKLNQRVYCNDLYIFDPQDEIHAHHTNCHLPLHIFDPQHLHKSLGEYKLTNDFMYRFHHLSGCTIATCGYLWFNAHSSEHNSLTVDPKLKENYRDSPQLEDQLISDLTHYYQQHTPAQRALQATQVSRSK